MKINVTMEVHNRVVCGHFEAVIIKVNNDKGELETKSVEFYNDYESKDDMKPEELEGLYQILHYMRIEGIF